MFQKFEMPPIDTDQLTLRPAEAAEQRIEAVVFKIQSAKNKETKWGVKSFAEGTARIFRGGKLEPAVEATLTGRYVARIVNAMPTPGTTICIVPITGSTEKGKWYDWENADDVTGDKIEKLMTEAAKPPF